MKDSTTQIINSLSIIFLGVGLLFTDWMIADIRADIKKNHTPTETFHDSASRGHFVLCPKCRLPSVDKEHFTEYSASDSICALHQACWEACAIPERVKLNVEFMQEYGWPTSKQLLVIKATEEGK